MSARQAGCGLLAGVLIFLAFYAAGRTLTTTAPAASVTATATGRVMGFTLREVPTPSPSPSQWGQESDRLAVCNGIDDLNCDDFASAAEAWAHIDNCGDEDGLDHDGDGRACEGR